MRPLPCNLMAELQLYWSCTLPLLCEPSPLVREKAEKWLGWLPKRCHTQMALGFTLAELLIALAILGVIATLTIPKLIVGQQNETYNAKAKEAIATVSSAFSYLQANGLVSSGTYPYDLYSYMNYAAYDTSTVIDNTYTNATTLTCSSTNPCLQLHNGAILFSASNNFGATAATQVIWFNLDPDGQATSAGTTDGPGKSFKFAVYYGGRISSRDEITPGSKNGGTTYNPASPAVNPPWFHW